MHICVDLIPKSERDYQDVVVIIDVLRTSTLAAMLFDHHLKSLYVGGSIRGLRDLAPERDVMLLGEHDGLPVEGFNHGKSPRELRQLDVTDKHAAIYSRNIARVINAASRAKHVLLGSFYNADAVVDQASHLSNGNVTLLCTGYNGNEDIDDTLCAGYLTAYFKRQHPDATIGGAAPFALSLLRAFPSPIEALWQSYAGQVLRHQNLVEDIAVCSLIGQTKQVPQLMEQIDETMFRFDGFPSPI